jgi:hypothetical protein
MLQMQIFLSIFPQCSKICNALDAFFQGASNELLPILQFDVGKKL